MSVRVCALISRTRQKRLLDYFHKDRSRGQKEQRDWPALVPELHTIPLNLSLPLPLALSYNGQTEWKINAFSFPVGLERWQISDKRYSQKLFIFSNWIRKGSRSSSSPPSPSGSMLPVEHSFASVYRPPAKLFYIFFSPSDFSPSLFGVVNWNFHTCTERYIFTSEKLCYHVYLRHRTRCSSTWAQMERIRVAAKVWFGRNRWKQRIANKKLFLSMNTN